MYANVLGNDSQALDAASKWTSVVVALTTGFLALFVYWRSRITFGKLRVDLRPPTAPSTDPDPAESVLLAGKKDIDPAERQYLLLKAYHEQSLNQSRVSMWFSLVFAAIGFAVIILAIFGNSTDRLIKVGSGSVIDAVAGLFFVQSNKARELMSTFFDKLRTDRKLDESLALVAAIPDLALKSKVQVLLALNFAEVKIEDSTLCRLIDPVDLAAHITNAVSTPSKNG